MKYYKIDGNEFFCDELSLIQDELVVGILGEMEFSKILELWGYLEVVLGSGSAGDLKGSAGASPSLDKAAALMGVRDIDINGILRALSEKHLLRRLVATVLTPKDGDFDEGNLEEIEALVGKLKRTEYVEVIRDFLSKNADSISNVFVSLESKEATGETAGASTPLSVNQKSAPANGSASPSPAGSKN